MKARSNAWIPIGIVVILTTVMACTAEVTIPQIVISTPAQSSGQSTALVPVTGPTLDPALAATECPNGDCANVCLSRLSSIPQRGSASESQPKAGGQNQKGASSVVLVTYPVAADKLGEPAYSDQIPADLSALQKDEQGQQKIWEYFSAIIPAAQRTNLAYFVVATDGRGGMLASVEQFSGHTGLWALVVDPADASRPRDLTFTLMHEFGHLLTLDSTQVKPDEQVLSHPGDAKIRAQEAAACPQYFASSGCSQPDSYINQFFERFWTKIYGEWGVVNAARQQSNYIALLARFYHRHPTQFITAYSATSVEEDMAETWAYFVLNPKPADDTMAHRKVLFFYEYPELVALRNEIASNICTYAASR